MSILLHFDSDLVEFVEILKFDSTQPEIIANIILDNFKKIFNDKLEIIRETYFTGDRGYEDLIIDKPKFFGYRLKHKWHTTDEGYVPKYEKFEIYIDRMLRHFRKNPLRFYERMNKMWRRHSDTSDYGAYYIVVGKDGGIPLKLIKKYTTGFYVVNHIQI